MDEEITQQPKILALISPEGIIVMGVAVFLDLAGLAFFILDFFYGIGEIPSWISDGIGLLFFGLWLIVRSAFVPGTTSLKELAEAVAEKHRMQKQAAKEAQQVIKAAGKGGRTGLRFAITFAGEVFPTGFIPFWSWFVWSELTKT